MQLTEQSTQTHGESSKKSNEHLESIFMTSKWVWDLWQMPNEMVRQWQYRTGGFMATSTLQLGFSAWIIVQSRLGQSPWKNCTTSILLLRMRLNHYVCHQIHLPSSQWRAKWYMGWLGGPAGPAGYAPNLINYLPGVLKNQWRENSHDWPQQFILCVLAMLVYRQLLMTDLMKCPCISVQLLLCRAVETWVHLFWDALTIVYPSLYNFWS